ncbi:MAG: hypothetical protein ABMA13_21235 [Chthoniobacteraceae bacterium]
MNKNRKLEALALVLLLASCALPASAQDFFRELGTSRSSGGIGPIVPSEYGYREANPTGLNPVTQTPQAGEEDQYNMAVGPVRMSVAVGVGMEWNDNIALSDNNRESDFIFRPLINVDFLWPISELNTLRFNVGASWAKYLEHSEYDSGGLILSPNSEIALTLQVGAIQVTLRDRFSYQEQPYEIAPLSNVARYERYENQAGIQFDWPINERLDVMFGYDHYNIWSRNDAFKSEDRSVDTVFIKPGFELSPGLKLGVVSSFSFINFDVADRSDATNLLAGPFIDWQITPYLNAYLEVGFQGLKFDGTSSYTDDFFTEANAELFRDLTDEQRRLFTDSSDSDSIYFKFQLTHTPNDVFEHGLLASRTSEIGFGSNFYDLYHFEYGATYKGIYQTEISPVIFYEHYETSGNFSETAYRVGAAIGIRHHLTNSLTVGLDYRFLLKDSDVENADYYQNLVFLSLYYRF